MALVLGREARRLTGTIAGCSLVTVITFTCQNVFAKKIGYFLPGTVFSPHFWGLLIQGVVWCSLISVVSHNQARSWPSCIFCLFHLFVSPSFFFCHPVSGSQSCLWRTGWRSVCSTLMWRDRGRRSSLTQLVTRTSTCTRCYHWYRSLR